MLGLGMDMKYLNLFKLVLLGASTTEMSNLNNLYLYLYMYIVIHVLCRYSICISCHVTDPNTISVIPSQTARNSRNKNTKFSKLEKYDNLKLDFWFQHLTE